MGFLPSPEERGPYVCLNVRLRLSHRVQEGSAPNSRDLQTSFLLGAPYSGLGAALKGRLMGLFGQGLSVHIFPALKVELGQNLRQGLIKRTPKERSLRDEQSTPSFIYFRLSTGFSATCRSWQVWVIRSTRLAAWPGEGLASEMQLETLLPA